MLVTLLGISMLAKALQLLNIPVPKTLNILSS